MSKCVFIGYPLLSFLVFKQDRLLSSDFRNSKYEVFMEKGNLV